MGQAGDVSCDPSCKVSIHLGDEIETSSPHMYFKVTKITDANTIRMWLDLKESDKNGYNGSEETFSIKKPVVFTPLEFSGAKYKLIVSRINTVTKEVELSISKTNLSIKKSSLWETIPRTTYIACIIFIIVIICSFCLIYKKVDKMYEKISLIIAVAGLIITIVFQNWS